MKKKIIASLLSLAMCFTIVPAAALTAVAASQPATTTTTKLLKKDSKTKEITLSKGITAKGSAKLTRTHMAAILTTVFNPQVKATSYKATGVTKTNKDVITKAIAMGLFSKTSKFSATKTATREEAFLAVQKAFQIKGTTFTAWESLTDAKSVSKDAQGIFAYLAKNNLIDTSDNKFNPKSSITVDEFTSIVNKLAGTIINKKGTYSSVGNGNVTVATKDVILKNATVKKNLTVTDGVGTGDVTLDKTKVTGRTVVRGGGSNSFKVTNGSKLTEIVVQCLNSDVRIYSKGSDVKSIYVNDGNKNIIIEANTPKLTVNSTTPVTLKADVDTLSVTGAKSDITVTDTSTVKTVDITKSATDTKVQIDGTATNVNTAAPKTAITAGATAKIENVTAAATAEATTITTTKGSEIKSVVTEAPKTEITGAGTVEKAEIKGNDSKIDTVGTEVKVGKDVTGTTSGDKELAGGTEGTTTDKGTVTPPTPEIPSGGGGGVPAKTYRVNTAEDLTTTLTKVNNGDTIEISGTLGSTTEYTNYTVNKSITIKGAENNKIYGSFTAIINGVTFDGLNIYNQGGIHPHKNAIDLVGTSITIKNCNFTLGNESLESGLVANGVVIWPNSKDQSNLNITGNTFNGYNKRQDYSSTGILITEKTLIDSAICPTPTTSTKLNITTEQLIAMSNANTFNDCNNNINVCDWGSDVKYSFT